MAIIKQNKYTASTAILIEDPTPSSNKMYSGPYETYNKLTFDFIFDTSFMNATAVNTASTSFGTADMSVQTGQSSHLILKGETTTINSGRSSSTNNHLNNLDIAPFLSMDPSTPILNCRYDTDGTNTAALMLIFSNYPSYNSNFGNRYIKKVNYTGDFSSGITALNANTYTGLTIFYPLYRETTTNNLIGIGSAISSLNYIPGRAYGMHTPAFGTSWAISSATNETGGGTVQFIGKSQVTGLPLYLTNEIANDYTQSIYSYTSSSTSNTALYTFNTAPATGGTGNTSAGGARAQTNTTAGGGVPCVKYASKTFPDPASPSTKKGFYVPFLDTSGNYHPMYFQWTLSNDTFVRNAITTTSYAVGNQATYWTADLFQSTAVSSSAGLNKIWFNDVFTFSGTNYLIWMQLTGYYGGYDGTATQRTFVVYSIGASDGTALTYHSSIVVPYTPINIIWLNDSRTQLGVFTTTNFYIYTFNATNGFVLTSNQPYSFSQVGRDSLGRIWAVDNGPYGVGRLHLLNGAAPASVTVVPAANAYTYSGTNIATTVAVAAYDISGNRVAATVVLTTSGSPLFFLSNSVQVTTITVTTSTSADVSIDAVVTASGSSTISATLSI